MKNIKLKLFFTALIAVFIFSVNGCKDLKNPSAPLPAATKTIADTATVSPTATITMTPLPPTATSSATPSKTATRTRTYTATPTETFYAGTPTDSPTETLTFTVSPTFTITLTHTLSSTPSATRTVTETRTVTSTKTITQTASVSPTVTITLTPLPCATDTGYKTLTTAGVVFQYKIINCGTVADIILSATGTGWVAVGWHGNTSTSVGKGQGASILIGNVVGGVATVRDDLNTGTGNTHVDDTTIGGVNNVTNLSGTEIGGVTELRFRYPLNTGDVNDVQLVFGKRYNFLLAYHSTIDSFTTKHTNKGVVTNTPF